LISIEDKVKESHAQLKRTTMAIEKKSCTCISISDFSQHTLKDVYFLIKQKWQ
jgi:hypothetical protein